MEKIKLIETVVAAQNGDTSALETLYREYAKPVYFLALKILANKEDSEDITQDVFIHMFAKINDLKNPETFPTWLNRITSNKCTDFLRKRKITLNIEDEEIAQTEFFEEKDPLLVPDKSLDNTETTRLIIEIIDNLPLPQRVCVYYYYYENLTIAQIAENLATNESTVKNRLALAREKIRKALEELEDKEGIKLYAMPLLITPMLRLALQQFQMPQVLTENMLDTIKAEAVTNTAAAASVIKSTATTATASALSTKAVAGIVAGVVVVAGITAALVFGNFGGNDEPVEPVILDGYEIEDEEEPAPANIIEAEPDIEDDEPQVFEIINERGNTTGNIVNGGLAAIQNNVIFYSNINNNGNIHRFNANGTGLGIVNSDNSKYINVIGDWIYYSNMSYGGRIYKIRTDGTDRIRLTDIAAEYINVVDDWIYFSLMIGWEQEHGGIYRIKTDGTQLELLKEDKITVTVETEGDITRKTTATEYSTNITVVGDWIYYVHSVTSGVLTTSSWGEAHASGSRGKIYRIRTDGSETELLLDSDSVGQSTIRLNIEGDRIYYYEWRMFRNSEDNWSNSTGFYKMNLDGSNITKLNEDVGSGFNVHGDWIYYFSRDDDFIFLYKSRLDGTEKTLLGEGSMMSLNINIVADFIYFANGFGEYLELYRVRTDGTGLQRVN